VSRSVKKQEIANCFQINQVESFSNLFSSVQNRTEWTVHCSIRNSWTGICSKITHIILIHTPQKRAFYLIPRLNGLLKQVWKSWLMLRYFLMKSISLIYICSS